MMTEFAVTARSPRRRPVYAALKRSLDFGVAALGLIVLSPLFLLAAVAVRLDSSGPVFYRQERVGRGFRPFRMFKFRTMVTDAYRHGGSLTVGNDPRITRVGRWLRKTKVDELPQLINVARGDMSLVGPRPEVARYVELFRDDYAYVLSVRPGLTDPASIKYRDEAAVLAVSSDPEREYVERILPDKLAIARAYLDRATILSDLGVLLRTLFSVAR